MLFLAGCEVQMVPDQIEAVSKMCNKNGGIDRVWLLPLGDSTIQCKDGATFKYIITRP